MSIAEFCRAFGAVPRGTYMGWIGEGSATDAATLKTGVEGLGVWERERLLWWLADGKGPKPAWLEDDKQDPFGGPPAANVVAMPREAYDAIRNSLPTLKMAVAEGASAEGASHVAEVWTILRKALPDTPTTPGTPPRTYWIWGLNGRPAARINYTAQAS